MKKQLLYALTSLAILVSGITFLIVSTQEDPRYKPQPTTYEGKPAFGQLTKNNWYTFYTALTHHAGNDPFFHGKKWHVGEVICSMPAGEAIHFH